MPRRDPADLLDFNDQPVGLAYYRIGDITVEVQSDLPITEATYAPKFRQFATTGPGPDTIVLRHRFGLPDIDAIDFGNEVYKRPPWIISSTDATSVYRCVIWPGGRPEIINLVVADAACSRIVIFNRDDQIYARGSWYSLSFLPTDQILLARALAERDACFMHAAGVILNGCGLLFVGHSEAGKSTMVRMLAERGEVLCDDRIIVRSHAAGFRIHGTWSHGDIPLVSGASAPLRAILFLNKSSRNKLAPLAAPRQALSHLLACLIQPLATAEWFTRCVSLLDRLSADVPCYNVEFDKSGAILSLLEDLVGQSEI